MGLVRRRGPPRVPARRCRRPRLLRADAQLVRHLRRGAALDRPRDPAGALRRHRRRPRRLDRPRRSCAPARLRARLGRDRGLPRPRAVRRLPVAQAGLRPGGLALRSPRRARRGTVRRVSPSPSPARSSRSTLQRALATREATDAGVCRPGGSSCPWRPRSCSASSGWRCPLPTDGQTAQFLGVQGNVARPGLDFNAERRAVLDNHVAATLKAQEDVDSRARAGAGPRRVARERVGHRPAAQRRREGAHPRDGRGAEAAAHRRRAARGAGRLSLQRRAALRARQGQHRPLRRSGTPCRSPSTSRTGRSGESSARRSTSSPDDFVPGDRRPASSA